MHEVRNRFWNIASVLVGSEEQVSLPTEEILAIYVSGRPGQVQSTRHSLLVVMQREARLQPGLDLQAGRQSSVARFYLPCVVQQGAGLARG
jgi:hypothetical protein